MLFIDFQDAYKTNWCKKLAIFFPMDNIITLNFYRLKVH